MKPEKLFNLIAGVTLLAMGVIALAGNTFLATQAWKLWPVIILLAGVGLTFPGFLGFVHRGFGAISRGAAAAKIRPESLVRGPVVRIPERDPVTLEPIR